MSSMEQTFSDCAIACGYTTGIKDTFRYDSWNLVPASATSPCGFEFLVMDCDCRSCDRNRIRHVVVLLRL